MKFRFYLLFFFAIWSIILEAQPMPCIVDEMTPQCEDACVVCDIDGFSGRNTSNTPGQRPSNFCTGTNQRITWIAFIAGTPNLVLDVFVSNCQIGWGLEVGIYESLDCETTRLISNCDGGMPPNSTTRFTVTEPLVVGQYYFFVMDGDGGDECDYRVTVIEGSTSVGNLADINFIDGIEETCLGDTANYEVPFRLGANFQQWYLNGQLIHEQDTMVEIIWDTPGTYDLCYTAFNVCDTIPPFCKRIKVLPIPIEMFRDTVCLGDCFYVESLDTTICDAGRTIVQRKTVEGCTEEFWIDLEILPTPSSDLELEFCFGDSVKIGSEFYFETGNFQASLVSREGCDSIVNLTINTFLCDINGGFTDDNLDCAGEADGQLNFTLLDGTYPYDYQWEEKTGSGLTGLGISTTPGDVVVIDNLPMGIYSVTVTDADNSRGIFIGQIFEPDPIIVEFETSNYNGFGVTCPENNDGSITLSVEGGSGNYRYNWEDSNSIGTSRAELEAGVYAVSITDDSGCEVILFPEITAGEPIVAELSVTQPTCTSENSGIISITSIKGGVAPFAVSFNNEPFSDEINFGNLTIGEYDLEIMDANGCMILLDTILTEPNDLTLTISGEEEMFLGDSILLSAIVNDLSVGYEWSGGAAISCPDCPETYIRPFQNSTYQLKIFTLDGCEQIATISIKVIDRKRVYFPSAFSPNNDGINDIFSIFTGPEVTQILEFSVFGRWGEQLYKIENFQNNNIETVGWDGFFRGNLMQTGTYTWFARVEFIDGVVEIYEGDLSLFR